MSVYRRVQDLLPTDVFAVEGMAYTVTRRHHFGDKCVMLIEASASPSRVRTFLMRENDVVEIRPQIIAEGFDEWRKNHWDFR